MHLITKTARPLILALAGSACWALASPAGADTIRISQDFDDTSVFDAGSTAGGFRGNLGTPAGNWNFYGNVNGPLLINDGSAAGAAYTGPVFSGTQSAAIVRSGSSFTGRVNIGVADDADYEIQFWLYRNTEAGLDSSFVFNATPSGGGSFEASGFIEDDGRLLIRSGDNAAWLATGLSVAEGVWTRIRLIVDRDGGTQGQYTLAVMPDGGSESFALEPQDLIGSVASIAQLNFYPQAPTGGVSYIDNILLIEGERVIPEPATMALLGASVLLLLPRRRGTDARPAATASL